MKAADEELHEHQSGDKNLPDSAIQEQTAEAADISN